MAPELWSPTTLLVALLGVLGIGYVFVEIFLRGLKGHKLFPLWLARWLALSSLIVFWDAAFVLLRPWSMKQLLWQPYEQYVQIDRLYGDMDDSFVYSQSCVNLLENAMNLWALRLARAEGGARRAAVVALIASTMTCSKTILYHLIEINSGFHYTKQNDWSTFITAYIIPNGIWIWVPLFAIIKIGNALAADPKAD